MANTQGTAIWYERIGPDIDDAQRFYADVVGWRIVPSGMDGFDYRIAAAPDDARIAGFCTPPDGMPIPPGWLIYYGVDDVDASAARVTELGGTVVMPPMSLDKVGRFALVTDPQGIAFYLMRGENEEEESTAFLQGPGNYGHGVWNELATPDPDAAFAFYGALFDWVKADAMPMGPMGDYAFIGAGEARPGAVMSSTTTGAPAAWDAYFHVPDIDAAVAAVMAGGGATLQPPTPIPGGDFSAKVADASGLAFGLVGARKGA